MIIFGPNHFVRKAQTQITEICKPLFEKLALNYFHYCRMYKNGLFYVLYSRMDWSDHFYQKEYRCEIPLPQHQIQLGKHNLCLWQGAIQENVVKDARNFFNLDHPLAINIGHTDYFDCFVFATHTGNDRVLNTYFNNIELLLNFTREFKHKAATLIQKSAQQKILLPEFSRAKELTILDDLSAALTIKGHLGKVQLTVKEMEVFRLLCQHFTMTQIAEQLNRSPRTIESHIIHLKNKLGCRTKSALIALNP